MTADPTPREIEVFNAVRAHDCDRKAAAHALGITVGTVNVHLQHLREKLGVHSMLGIADRLTFLAA